MKVITERVWTLQVDCESCKSTLEVEVADVTVTVYEDDPSSYWCACAVCGASVKIATKSVPAHVQSAAYKKRGR